MHQRKASPARRLTVRVGGLAVACAMLLLCALSAASAAPERAAGRVFPAVQPEPGTAIPSLDVKFGMRPYADNSFQVIAMKKGWFKDVGINIVPPPYGIKDSDNATALMLKGQVDVQAQFGPTLIPSMKATNSSIKMVALTDLFGGWAILANPKLGLKTVKQYMAEGLGFKAAMRKTLAPVAKETLVVAPLIDARIFDRLAFQLAGLPLPKLQVLDDSKSLVLAKAGRINLATPTGAPITLSFQQAGWTPLVTPFDILENVKGGPKSPVEALVGTVGVAANESFINDHPEGILRVVSVLFRTIDAIQKNPKEMINLQVPYLNSVAGTNLDWKAIKQIFDHLDPLSNWEYQANYCTKKTSALYYKNAYTALLNDAAKQKLIPAGRFVADDLIWACQVYDKLKSYQTQTDKLLASLKGKKLTPEKTKLVKQANRYYAWFDFLDAYRSARAAAA